MLHTIHPLLLELDEIILQFYNLIIHEQKENNFTGRIFNTLLYSYIFKHLSA